MRARDKVRRFDIEPANLDAQVNAILEGSPDLAGRYATGSGDFPANKVVKGKIVDIRNDGALPGLPDARSQMASKEPRDKTARANHPKIGAIAANSATARMSSRFPPYLPVINVVTGAPSGAEGVMTGADSTSRANAQ